MLCLLREPMQILGSASVLLIVVLGCLPLRDPAAVQSGIALELTTEVINQAYCVGDADLDGVRLRLKLRYRNIGDRPIILHKSSTTVFRVIVRKSPEGETESNAQLSVYSTGPWKVSDSSLKKAFVILQPQDVYDTETNAGVFVVRDEEMKIQGAVCSGDHYLQLSVATWGGSHEAEDYLSQKWQSRGVLWTDSVISKPMKFSITQARTVRDCN